MNTRLLIRPEQPQDIKVITELTKRAFEEAPYSDHNEHYIVNALRNRNELTISLVAQIDNQIVGHIAISPVQISLSEENWFGLGPVSVLPEYQRQGIGSALIQQALANLKTRGAKGCVLLGEPAYYSKFGFKAIDGLTLADVPAEYFQAMSFTGHFAQGEVLYSSAFQAKS